MESHKTAVKMETQTAYSGGSGKMQTKDNKGSIKMETEPTCSNGGGDNNTCNRGGENKSSGKSTTMIMPTGPAPIITNKHPVMHLNELTSDVKYELVSEDKEFDAKNKRHKLYTMLLTANNEKFQGVGQSKKAAKEEAAKYALLKLFGYLYIPDVSLMSFVPEGTVLGKRLGEQNGPVDTESKKKKKKKKDVQEGPKNPVMRLNEIRSGLDYHLDSRSGPVHAPLFCMSLVVDGVKYEGCGSSKKKAKLDVATKALMVIEPQSVVEQIVQCEPTTTT